MFNYEKGMYNALVPTVIEQTGKGERAYDIFSRLLNDRIVFNNIEGVDYYIENEDGVLEVLAKKIYDIYKGE